MAALGRESRDFCMDDYWTKIFELFILTKKKDIDL